MRLFQKPTTTTQNFKIRVIKICVIKIKSIKTNNAKIRYIKINIDKDKLYNFFN